MIVKVRLHRPHDMDLITMKRTEGYQLGREMKKCLVSYAKGEAYTPKEFKFGDQTKGYVEKCCQIHIALSESKPMEADAIKILREIRSGYRCAFLKALFRNCVPFLPLMAYADKNGYVTSKNAIFSDRLVGKKGQGSKMPVSGTEENKNNEEIREEEGAKAETPKVPENNDDFDSLFAGFEKLGR